MIKLFHVCFILLYLFVVDVTMADDEIKSKNKKPAVFKKQKKKRSLAQKAMDKKKRKEINRRKLYKHIKFK